MFGIGWTELIMIALVLLIFVGPRELPGMMQKVARIIAEFRSASRELRNQVTEEVRDIERSMGDIPSPSKIIKDIPNDLLESINESPYKDAVDAKKEITTEIEDIKNNLKGDDKPAVKKNNPQKGDEDEHGSKTMSSSEKPAEEKPVDGNTTSE